MLNKIDKIMMGLLLALLVLSGGVLWQNERELPVEPEVTVHMVVEDVQEKPIAAIPDFSDMLDVKAKKSAFFGFLLPIVQQENGTILKNRERVIALSSLSALTEQDKVWLADMAKEYRLRDVRDFDEEFFQALLARVDTIPASLALAQSANESAWGTSRFARQGNNFFGQWCFRPGCGMVPRSRPEGETYEVQKFEDVAASVSSYMYNLNTNHRYRVFRELREQRRVGREQFTGADLAPGLQAYSIRGTEYIEELLSMINSNKLLQYDLGDQS